MGCNRQAQEDVKGDKGRGTKLRTVRGLMKKGRVVKLLYGSKL